MHKAEQVPKDPRNTKADPLALFGAESLAPRAVSRDAGPDPLTLFGAEPESRQATNEDEIDTLIIAVAADGRVAAVAEQPTAITPPLHTAKRVPSVRSVWLFQKGVPRWTAVTLSVFVAGVVIAQWGFRLLERRPGPGPVSSVRTVEPVGFLAGTPSTKTVPATLRTSSPVAEAPFPSLPGLSVQSTMPRRDDAAAVTASPDDPRVAPKATEREILVPTPAAPTRADSSTAAGGGTDVARAPAPVDSRPLDIVPAPAVSSTLSPVGETISPAPPVMPSVSEGVPPRLATPRAAMETAVRGALQQYAAAYGNMNVTATAEVWPSVDRRALARAFATLKSQALTFDRCDVSLTESSATVRCLGTVHFVRKVGNPAPRSEHQQWLFTMGKSGTAWKIEKVIASPASAPTPSRAGAESERAYRQ